MSKNAPETYGTDVAAMDDADGLFSPVTGLGAVRQAAYHRLTNDSVLGTTDPDEPNENTDDWGYDVQRLAGMRTDDIASIQPTLSGVLQRDPRIDSADVSIQQTRVGSSLWSVVLTVTCTTALGPFSLVLGINDVTVAILGGSPA